MPDCHSTSFRGAAASREPGIQQQPPGLPPDSGSARFTRVPE